MTTTAPTTPLTRSKHESRGFLLILLRMATMSSLPPPSLASVRWGCVLVYSTGTTTTATTTPLARSKRKSRGFLLILLRTATTSSLPPPSLASARWGCVLVYSTGTTTATTSPLARSKRKSRGFLLITQDSRHVITTTPPCLQVQGGGVFSFILLG